MKIQKLISGLLAFTTAFSFFSLIPAAADEADFSITETDQIDIYENDESEFNALIDTFFPDVYEIPAGWCAKINLDSFCALTGLEDVLFMICDMDTAAFGDLEEHDISDKDDCVLVGKNPGETQYILSVKGFAVKEGIVRVCEPDAVVFDFNVTDCDTKVREIYDIIVDGEHQAAIFTSDKDLYTFDGKEYKKISENAKHFYSFSSEYGNPLFVLHTDGSVSVDGKVIPEVRERKEYLICGENYLIVESEDNKLWDITYDNGEINVIKITDSCVSFSENKKICEEENGNSFLLDPVKGTRIEIGDISVKNFFDYSSDEAYIYDYDNNIWKFDKNAEGDERLKLYAENVSEFGEYYAYRENRYNSGYRSDGLYVYKSEEGKMYSLLSKEEFKPDKKYFIESAMDIGGIMYGGEIFSYSVDKEAEVFKDKDIDDFFKVITRYDRENQMVTISFGSSFDALKDPYKTYGTLSDGNDSIVLIAREDGTLWQYYVGQRKFVRKSFDERKNHTISDLISLVNYMHGTSDEITSDLDMNYDGKYNIADVILLKDELLGE